MKRIIVILALVAVACAPAMAAVEICSEKSGNTVTVKYRVVSGPNSVRAFALDLSVSTGTVTGVTCSNASYYIYPGSIQITGGSVSSYGSCICSSSYPGTKGGVGTSGVTVEMGSLYTGTNKPATSGTLLTFGISATAATVTVAAEPVRGGVVMENPGENPGLTVTTAAPGQCFAGVVECFPSTYTSYADWKTMGKPDCWCGTNTVGMSGTVAWKFQCYGDGDNLTETLSKYRVYTNDYWKMKSNWRKKISELSGANACADFDHKSETLSKYRVYTNDYWRMKSNWRKKDSQFPGSGNCPAFGI